MLSSQDPPSDAEYAFPGDEEYTERVLVTGFGTARTVSDHTPPRRDRDQPILIVVAGTEAGRVLPLIVKPALSLGRAPECDLRFDDPKLSRQHAYFVRVAGEVLLEDAKSTNGCYVNDTRVQGSIKLRDGDRLQCGDTILRFSMVLEHEREALESAWRSSVRDPLTGIFNRKALEERLTAEVAFSLRHRTPLALVLLDLDHFKRVNDTYGHPAGDAVLRAVARTLQGSIRAEDLLARYGGEEFVVVARGLELEAAWAMSERLLMLVANRGAEVQGQRLDLTISAGVACLDDCGGSPSAASLVGIADRRLYRAKVEGRNRVIADG